MEKGKYNGFFQFNNEKISKSSGFDKTYFTIEVTDSDEQHFQGWVEDDISSGGMEGKGVITGNIKDTEISFVKNMPYRNSLVKDITTDKYQSKTDKNRKHPPIYYSGIETEKDCYKGEWDFKYGILINIIIWLKGIKTGGTWEMSKIKE